MPDEYPTQRFVKVRPKDDSGYSYTVTFLAADEDDTSNPEDNGIVQYIAENMPDKKDRVVQLLTYLKANESSFFEWLEESPQNSLLFAQNPLEAILEVLPNAPGID